MTTVQTLMPRHYKIMDLYLEGIFNHKEIAEKVGVSPVTVKNVLNMDDIQHQIAVRRRAKQDVVDCTETRKHLSTVENAREKITAEASKAASVLIDNLLDDDNRIRNKAANDILDRVGISRIQKQDIESKTSVLILDATQAATIARSFELDHDD